MDVENREEYSYEEIKKIVEKEDERIMKGVMREFEEIQGRNREYKQRQNKSIDWEALQTDWVVGEMIKGVRKRYTHKELAVKYNCSLKAIQKRSSEEKWGLQRELYNKRIKEEMEENRFEIRHQLSSRTDLKHINSLERVQNLIDEYIEEIEQRDSYSDEEAVKIKPAELKVIVDMIEKKHKIVRDIYDEGKSLKEKVDIKRDQLKTEKEEEISKDPDKLLKEMKLIMKDIEMN